MSTGKTDRNVKEKKAKKEKYTVYIIHAKYVIT
jgi:hypothetical protein